MPREDKKTETFGSPNSSVVPTHLTFSLPSPSNNLVIGRNYFSQSVFMNSDRHQATKYSAKVFLANYNFSLSVYKVDSFTVVITSSLPRNSVAFAEAACKGTKEGSRDESKSVEGGGFGTPCLFSLFASLRKQQQ